MLYKKNIASKVKYMLRVDIFSKCSTDEGGDVQNAQSRAGVKERKDFNGAVDRKP